MNTIDILISIRQIMRSINQESKRIDKDYGVSIPQILCLNYLKRSPNFQSTQNELRIFLNLNGSSMHGLVDRLEKKGLIARLPKSGDRRKVQISLTAKGDKLTGTIPPTLLDRLAKNLELQDEETLAGLKHNIHLLIQLMEINISNENLTTQ
jgi:DNA-binding MarR family transcriptional regulator